MIRPTSYESLAALIEKEDKLVLFFTADWCPDCQFIYPIMPEKNINMVSFAIIA